MEQLEQVPCLPPPLGWAGSKVGGVLFRFLHSLGMFASIMVSRHDGKVYKPIYALGESCINLYMLINPFRLARSNLQSRWDHLLKPNAADSGIIIVFFSAVFAARGILI